MYALHRATPAHAMLEIRFPSAPKPPACGIIHSFLPPRARAGSCSELEFFFEMNPDWPPRRGYCAPTDEETEGGCSAARKKGTWVDLFNASACFSMCSQCAACTFVSYSRRDLDCSWFSECPRTSTGLSRSHQTFRLKTDDGSLVDVPALLRLLDEEARGTKHAEKRRAKRGQEFSGW